jgi:exopolysaccharide biosynthesis polyprenyl glycosylphosphotransferase
MVRSSQFRDGSRYSNFRKWVPAPVLLVLALWIIRISNAADYPRLVNRATISRHLLLACGVVGLWNLCLGFSIFNKISVKRDLRAEFARLATASVACGLLLLADCAVRGLYAQGLVLGAYMSSSLLFAALALLGGFLLAAVVAPRVLRSRTAIIVGTGPRASALRARLQNHYLPFEFYGCIDDEYLGADAEKEGYLGPIEKLAEILKVNPVEIVLIGLPMRSKYDQIQRVIRICETVGVESQYMLDIFETSHARVQLHSQEPRHFTVLSTLSNDPKHMLKRLFDLVGAAAILLIALPILVAAAIAVRLSSPGPIFFVQQRYGRHRKRFPMFKFRSMVVDAEQKQAALESRNEAQGPVFKLKSDPRITRVGAFLRKTSIDELPQLFNVLRGEMSLVGPRPLPLRDVSRFEEPWLLRRFSVRPGLTCLWQVNGRSNTSFDYWIRQDLAYIDKWSLGLDLKILLSTIPAVLKGSGAH